MHAIEVTVDVELEMQRWVIGRPPGLGGIDACEAQIAQIQRVNERINEANRIALVDPVIEAFRQQRRLRPIRSCNEASHQSPRRLSK
jgi:hypothetical protein